MCIAFLRFQPGTAHPLVIAANRDEFHTRPTQIAQYWPEQPQLLAGRDLKAGGTWLGVNPEQQRFALVTNYREPQQNLPPQAISRGWLVHNFLTGKQSVADYLTQLHDQRSAYAGFNILVGHELTKKSATLGYYSNRADTGPKLLAAGDYVLSNHLLNSPWPKTIKLAQHMQQSLQDEPDADRLLVALADTTQAPAAQLPNTGLSAELEALLSSIFIISPDYGTRSSTVLWLAASGEGLMTEQSFDALGQTTNRIDWPLKFG